MTHRNKYRWPLLAAVALSLPLIATSCKDDDPTPEPPQNIIEVKMQKTWEAYYFEPNYNNDPTKPIYSNYFVELAQGEVGSDGFLSYPMTEGEYILDLDLHVLGLSENSDEPILPEGTYTPVSGINSDTDVDHTFSLVNTILIKNIGESETGESKFHYYKFSDGTITITKDGDNFKIDANLTCTLASSDPKEDGTEATEPTVFHCTFTGEVPVFNPKEKEIPYNYDKDLDITGAIATARKYEDENQDNYVFRCFSSTQLTSDGIHVNGEGTKLQFNLYTPKGSGIAGDYTIRNGNADWTASPGERMASMATGSFAETADKILDGRLQPQYSLLKSGKLSIKEIGNNKYTVTADCIDTMGFTVKLSYTGEIITGSVIVPTTTLTADVAFNPIGVSQIITFGDYFSRGITNIWLSLANENEVMTFDMFLPGSNVTEIPTGTFSISETQKEFTMLPGTIEDSAIAPSFYLQYDPTGTSILNYATVNSGTLEITRSGNLYTFKIEVYDNYSPDMHTPAFHKISGQVTCKVPEFTPYTDIMSAPGRVKGLTPDFSGKRRAFRMR